MAKEPARPKTYALDTYKQKSQARHPKMRSWGSYIVGMEGRPVVENPVTAPGKTNKQPVKKKPK